MPCKTLASACLVSALLLPGYAPALQVKIQGKRLEPSMEGASCVEIAGEYPGLTIKTDLPGQAARICHNASRVNSISIVNAMLIAKHPVRQPITVQFEHEFPAGINGKIMARAKLRGFFATHNGVGVPKRDKLLLKAFFSQDGTDDIIGEPLQFAVGEELDSALIDYSVKEPYLVAGIRRLKGELEVVFRESGEKLTFPGRCVISLDSGAMLEDKLETLDVGDDGEEAPVSPEGANPQAPPVPSEDPGVPGLPGTGVPLESEKPAGQTPAHP